ncbi:MAG: hypothetical protein ACR2P6_02765 [Gammaproteobacteria bacterium]
MPELKLLPSKIMATADQLERRVIERFPGSGLVEISHELQQIARIAKNQSEQLARPVYLARAAMVVSLALLGMVIVFVFINAFPTIENMLRMDTADRLQSVESGIQQMVAAGIAFLFLFNLERRIKRQRALKAINRLRTVAHVIDMHQLTKDPATFFATLGPTESSPPRQLSAAELVRYLDYCSEMLSLLGKVAALYIQQFEDPVALAAASEVEQLTTGLSQKIWQKIMITEKIERSE